MNAWTILLLVVAVIFWVLRGGFKRLKEAKQRGDIISYQAGSQERNWALALAHPMAYHAMQGGFASDLHGADDALAKQLRPMILHHLGLRTDLSDEQVRQQLPDAMRQRWFMLDLQRLQRSDDARAAMAFACARVTFFVRSARLLDWVDEALHWDILQLNAQRAQQCFDSWLAFGQAYAQGRTQWLAQGRSDVLGKAFTIEEVAQWVTQEQHPWHAMRWDLPLSGDGAAAPAA
ncbi:hypothetical protein DJFAAGMI_02029 [Comamonas sp. PE63]|uniref:DUF1266 domain-containing protein n=1 Tax=Comamonas brasiliensis TaxID=1812482 RepID=A0ABS5LSK2_9BURK|nr:DUF1266 domain-containing protein [Comamonas sp. PE63]MBS3019286.1 hypothetical protein [Comamonas sp. PE63]